MRAQTEKKPSLKPGPTYGCEPFFATARERYRIRERKLAGLTPLTGDYVLASWRFCNVHREHDKTTKWFKEHIRDQLSHFSLKNDLGGIEAVIGTVGFRWFNRTTSGQPLVSMLRNGWWKSEEVRDRLKKVHPLVTGAYMIKTPTGMSKLDGICWCMEQFIEMGIARKCLDQETLQGLWEVLRTAPFLGDFMAYEIVSDLRWMRRWENAPDIMRWANPGPGCARGLGWVVDGHPEKFDRHDEEDRAEMLGLMTWLLKLSQDPANWPNEWRPWEMREVEHWLCEYDKYCRAAVQGQSLKRRYE